MVVALFGAAGPGGDGDANGGGGGAGVVLIGNVTLTPGRYFVQVGRGGRAAPVDNAPGYCGTPSILKTPTATNGSPVNDARDGVEIVADGGGGGNGVSHGRYFDYGPTREYCTGFEGGGGGAGPSRYSQNYPYGHGYGSDEHSSHSGGRIWRDASMGWVNMTQHAHTGGDLSGNSASGGGVGWGGGGGGAGGPGTRGVGQGGDALQYNFDGTARWWAAGGNGAMYRCHNGASDYNNMPGRVRSIGGHGGCHHGGPATPGADTTGSGGGGQCDNDPNAGWGEGVGGTGIVMIKYQLS